MKRKIFQFICIFQALCLAGCSTVQNEENTTTANDTTSEIITTADISTTTTVLSESQETSTTKITETTSDSQTTIPETEVSVSETVTTTTIPVTSEEISQQPLAESSTEPVKVEPQWTESEISKDLYVNTNGISSRKCPIQGYEKVRSFKLNDLVHVVAETNTSYFKTDNGDFIHKDYLSTAKVEIVTTTTTVSTTPKPTTSSAPKQKKYYDENAYIPIEYQYTGYNNDIFIDDEWTIDKFRRIEYDKLFKQLPGYVEGEFDFTNVPNNVKSLKYAHLTKADADKIKELSDHYWNDLRNCGWLKDENGNDESSDSYILSEKRGRVYNLIDAVYCAKNSEIGEYAPDGTQYIGKTVDGYCYTAKTGLSHLYWVVAPRELKQLPENTYFKYMGLGGEWSNEPGEGFEDVSGYYVVYCDNYVTVHDEGYKNKYFPEGGGGCAFSCPEDLINELYIV